MTQLCFDDLDAPLIWREKSGVYLRTSHGLE
jgi:hypothetical protein